MDIHTELVYSHIGYDVISYFRSAFLEVRKKQLKIPLPAALFALSLMQCQRCLKTCRVKNISNVFELNCAAFRLSPPYGGLLVNLHVSSIRSAMPVYHMCNSFRTENGFTLKKLTEINPQNILRWRWENPKVSVLRE